MVLVEGPARKQHGAFYEAAAKAGAAHNHQQPLVVLTGRTDTNKRVTFTAPAGASGGATSDSPSWVPLVAGDYAEVQVVAVAGHTLRGQALRQSSIAAWVK